MNKKSISISVTHLTLLGLVVGVALFATGLNASTLLAGKPSAALASYSVEQIKEEAQPNKDAPLTPVGSGFTYQGSLKSGGVPANGDHDFQFTLYDALSGGVVVGGPISQNNVTVADGLFSTTLDFGSAAFDGNARFLEIQVRQSGGGGYDTLSPRQAISPVPYALFAFKTQPYKNVVTVAQSGGQFTSVQAALDSITDASATNRYLVWVGPGVYSERVTMKQYVDIEGAGEKTTRLTFTGSPAANIGTVRGADDAELRYLTVENTGGNNAAVAVYNGFASPSLLHVTAIGFGGSLEDYGIYNFNSSPNMTDVVASASGGSDQNDAIINGSSSPTMINVTASASSSSGTPNNTGVANTFGSSPRIVGGSFSASGTGGNFGLTTVNTGNVVAVESSNITGSTDSIYNQAGSTVRVAASRLSGGPAFSIGTLVCVASYDGNNKRLGPQCTPDANTIYVAPTGGDFTTITSALNSITDNSSINPYVIKVAPGRYNERVTMKPYVDIEGSGENATRIIFTGATSATGTVVGASNAELRSLTVQNTGGNTFAVGISTDSASPTLRDITVITSGATSSNIGMANVSSAPKMTNVTIAGSGAGTNQGINNLASSPDMTNVKITTTGGTNDYGVVSNDTSAPTMIDVSILASGGSNSNIGVQTQLSSAKIIGSNIAASGNSSFGVYTQASGTVTIDGSKITTSGSGPTVSAAAGTTTRVGTSQLSGGPASGTLVCAAVYDENYTFYANTCP